MHLFTFEQLPLAVTQLHEKLNSIESLLLLTTESTTSEKVNLLTIIEAADLLSLSKNTIYGLVQRHKIPVCKKGKRLYFSKTDLLAWIEKGRQPTTTEIENSAIDYLTSSKRKNNHG